MACYITDSCISCGICIGDCPNNAVYITIDERYAIDPRKCTECIHLPRRRCETICCVGAIQLDPAHRETAQQRWAKHRTLHVANIQDLLGF